MAPWPPRLSGKTAQLIVDKDGTPVDLTTVVVGAATAGVIKHVWVLGETAALGKGKWPLRAEVTIGADVLTFPDADHPLWLEID